VVPGDTSRYRVRISPALGHSNRAHLPDGPKRDVSANYQVLSAGTTVHTSGGDHQFEAPDAYGTSGADEFVQTDEWVHYHD
jgi:hypothetical protein